MLFKKNMPSLHCKNDLKKQYNYYVTYKTFKTNLI